MTLTQLPLGDSECNSVQQKLETSTVNSQQVCLKYFRILKTRSTNMYHQKIFNKLKDGPVWAQISNSTLENRITKTSKTKNIQKDKKCKVLL